MGERSREGSDQWTEIRGVRGCWKRSSLVFGQCNEPRGPYARRGRDRTDHGLSTSGDVEHQNVLLFIDNIFRFVRPVFEVSALLGRMRFGRGSSAHSQPLLGGLRESYFHKNGSVTSVQAVYVPADDLTDPAPAATLAHLDATTVLSRRRLWSRGIYPAVDPLESTSRILERGCVFGKEHYEVANKVQQMLQV